MWSRGSTRTTEMRTTSALTRRVSSISAQLRTDHCSHMGWLYTQLHHSRDCRWCAHRYVGPAEDPPVAPPTEEVTHLFADCPGLAALRLELQVTSITVASREPEKAVEFHDRALALLPAPA